MYVHVFFFFLCREFAYSLRVRLLEAVDGQKHHLYGTTAASASTNASPSAEANDKTVSIAKEDSEGAVRKTVPSTTMEDWEEEDLEMLSAGLRQGRGVTSTATTTPARDEAQAAEVVDCGHCVDDLGR